MNPVFIAISLVLVSLFFFFSCTTITGYPPETGAHVLTTDIEDPQKRQVLEDFINDYIQANKIPGLQIAFESPLGNYSAVYGHRDNKRTQKMEPDSLLRTGSVGKSLTALLILQLVDDGVLSLDSTIDSYFPTIPHSNDITIRHLLNHTSGLPNTVFSPGLMGTLPFQPDKHWKYDELIKSFSDKNALYAPGEGFTYSNNNFILLSYIIESETSGKMAELFQERICQKAEMTHTTYVGEGLGNLKPIDGYDKSYIPVPGNYVHKGSMNFWNTLEKGAAGSVSCADDLLKLARAMGNREFLSDSSWNEMQQTVQFTFEETFGDRYSLGLAGYDFIDQNYYGHAGIDIGFSAFYCFSEDGESRFAVMCNASAVEMDKFTEKLIELLHT